MNRKKLPTSLIVVAILFIIYGVFSVIDVLVSLLHSHININLGVLGLFIGWGLLKLSRGWRTCALVFLWIMLVSVPLIGVLFVVVNGPLDVTVLGQKVGHAPKVVGLIFAAAVFAIAFWEYRVLTRPDIRRLFGIELDNG